MRRLVAIALIASSVSACTMTRNHHRGIAAAGAVTALFGGTVLADGMSCDTRYNVHSTCTHDSAELRNGAIISAVGLAAFGFGMWQLLRDREETAPRPLRLAEPTAPAAAPEPAPAVEATSDAATLPAPEAPAAPATTSGSATPPPAAAAP